MTKIIYNGVYNPCEIKVLDNKFKNWYKGETRNIPDNFAKILKEVKGFSLVKDDSKPAQKSQKKEPEPTEEKIVSDVEVDKDETIDLDTATKDELLDYTARVGIEADYWKTKDELKEIIRNHNNSRVLEDKKSED